MFTGGPGLVVEEHWKSDPRFKDDRARGDHGEITPKRRAAGRAERPTAEALAQLEAARIPAGPLYSPQQALDDPHIRAAGLVADMEYPGLPRSAPLAPTPVDLSETPGRLRHHAPTLGEHTDEILAELGYGPGAIAGLRARRVI